MAKTDMERLGLFSEPGYITISDKYKSSYLKPFNEKASKGKQLLVSSTKPKSGFQDGYFSEKFSRMMEGEAYSDPVKIRREHRVKEMKRNIAGTFIPSSVPKKPTGLGNYYGTLGGKVDAFSAANRPRSKYIPPKKNFLVNPPKKGTGYGYLPVTIGDWPKYESDPYDRALVMHRKEMASDKKKIKGAPFKLNNHPKNLFEENPFHSDKKLPPISDAKPKKDTLKPFKPSHPPKLMGGSKAGTFDQYPKHSEEVYPTKVSKPKKKFIAGVFRPSPFPKSRPVNSVVQQNVDRSMNVNNYLSMRSTTF